MAKHNRVFLRGFYERFSWFIITVSLFSFAHENNYDQYNNGRMQDWEDSLANEYGNLLIRQSTPKAIYYIFYGARQNKEGIFTMVTVTDGQTSSFTMRQSRAKSFKSGRYNPQLKYTTPIRSTNNQYLLRKFQSDTELSEDVMDEMILYYLTPEEYKYFKQLDLFRSIKTILPVFITRAVKDQ